MKDPKRSRADSAAQSRESYRKDLEKSRDDSAAQSCESYFIGIETGRGAGWATAPQYFPMY